MVESDRRRFGVRRRRPVGIQQNRRRSEVGTEEQWRCSIICTAVRGSNAGAQARSRHAQRVDGAAEEEVEAEGPCCFTGTAADTHRRTNDEQQAPRSLPLGVWSCPGHDAHGSNGQGSPIAGADRSCAKPPLRG